MEIEYDSTIKGLFGDLFTKEEHVLLYFCTNL